MTGRSLRVLLVHNRYREPGGEDQVVAREAALLREAGHDVHTFGAANPDGAVPAAAALLASPWNALAARRLRERVLAVRPDVVHVHNTWYALGPAALRAARAGGAPVVATLHNYRLVCLNGLLFRDGRPCEDCVGRAPLPGIQHACYRGSRPQSAVAAGALLVHRAARTFAESVDVYCALSAFGRDRFLAGGLPPDRVVVKPNFVDDGGPRREPPSASDEVLFVGRLSPEKGVAELLDAWEAAHPPGLRLRVIGTGEERRRLEGAAPAGVEFVGRLEPAAVRRRLRSARALAFPSRWYEGQPLVLLEALDAGLPIIGNDLGSTGELLRSVSPDLTLPSGDRTAWVEGLRRLSDGALVDRVGAAARARYLSDFTPAAALDALEAVYALAIARASGTGRAPG